MRSGLYLAEFGVTQKSDAKASRNYRGSSPIRGQTWCPILCAHVLAVHQVASCSVSKSRILDFDRMIIAWHSSNQTSKRLNCIPGVGPLPATALVASVADPKTFRSGSQLLGFRIWLALNSTRAGVGIGLAASANRGIAICAACSCGLCTRRHSLCQHPAGTEYRASGSQSC